MSEYSNSAMIAFPASWPTDIDEPHCTLMYLGDIDELNYGPLDVHAAIGALHLSNKITVPTAGVEWFGRDKDIPVVLLESQRIQDMFSMISVVLEEAGIENASDFADQPYRPHITFKNSMEQVPLEVELYRPLLYWGDLKF